MVYAPGAGEDGKGTGGGEDGENAAGYLNSTAATPVFHSMLWITAGGELIWGTGPFTRAATAQVAGVGQ